MKSVLLSLCLATFLFGSSACGQQSALGWPDETIDTWHGFKRHNFTIEGCRAWVVEPKQALAGKPWSWCMEFPDAFTERCAAPALLERGFHHAHVAVGNTFGSPKALEQFRAFHASLRQRGLAEKAVLIGLSRGGLYAYRFASENPLKVSVIYADAAVCDFKSWPGGKGKGKGSARDWADLFKCYGFKDEAEALAYQGNPIDVLKPLADAKIALIHVVGDADDVVPAGENTAIVEERYRKLGGRIEVIHKPGIGHHPHGLDDPAPVVKFILQHAAEPAAKPATDATGSLPSPRAIADIPLPTAATACSTATNGANGGAPVSAATPKPLGANQLPNPSFEEKAASGAPGWKSRAWSGEPNTRWSVESPGKTGKSCLSIASEKGGDAAWTTTVTVKPNAYYRLSGWIKTKDIRGAAGALLNIQNMQHVRTDAVSGTRDWTQVSTIFQSEAVTELEINCLFGGWGASSGQAWYDDVALEQVDAPPENTRASVTIDPVAPSVPYSPMIFGGFIEHFDGQVYGGLFEPGSPLSDARGFRKDVVEAVKELKVPVVRWPGGCFASGYHWEDGVGPDRKPTPDPVWGVVDPNTFGTDEFVEWCRLVGSEPYICTNAGNGTPEEMRQWVEYCNGLEGPHAKLRAAGRHEKPLQVRYWSIGNENWGGHEIGARTPDEWGPLVRNSAELMLAADPKLILLAAATPERGWTLPLLKAAGKHLDYVCIHEYWLGLWQKNDMPGYLPCIMASEGAERTILRVIDLLKEAGCRGRIKIAFDEWNLRGWHHPGFPRKQVSDKNDPAVKHLIAQRELNAIASQYSMADALFSASFLNACLRHADDVGMANIAPLVNTRGPIHVHSKGLVKRTTFHTLAMYANHLQSRVGQLDLKAGPLVYGNQRVSMIDAVATVDESGKVWSIALVNRHPAKEVACAIKMKDALLDGRFEATVLSGDSPDAFNDVERPDRVVPESIWISVKEGVVNLRPHSLMILKVRWNTPGAPRTTAVSSRP